MRTINVIYYMCLIFHPVGERHKGINLRIMQFDYIFFLKRHNSGIMMLGHGSCEM